MQWRKDRSALIYLVTCFVTFYADVPAAAAYVCSRVVDATGYHNGPSTAWFDRTVSFAFEQDGTAQLPRDATFATLRQAFLVWQNVTMRPNTQDPAGGDYCPDLGQTNLRFDEQPPTTQDFVGYNFLVPQKNQNVLVFRDAGWPHTNEMADETIALTTTTYSSQTGEIYDADIEFNSAGFAFSLGNNVIQTDLLNTAVHEIGHFIGFAHSANPIASMAPTATYRETVKRALSCDDAQLLLLRYPAGTDSVGYCDPPTLACGNCAAPQPLERRAEVQIVGSDSGLRSEGCSATDLPSAGGASWLLAVAAGRRAYVRRRGS